MNDLITPPVVTSTDSRHKTAVSLARAIRSGLDANLSSLPFPVSGLAPAVACEGGKTLSKQENSYENGASKRIGGKGSGGTCGKPGTRPQRGTKEISCGAGKIPALLAEQCFTHSGAAARDDSRRGVCNLAGIGRRVNRGAKGILIFAPIVRRKPEQSDSEEIPANARSAKLVGFRGVHVFAEEDTSGQSLPRLSACSGEPSTFVDRLRQFVTDRGIQIEYSGSIRPAQGQCSASKITLLPGMDSAVEFSVLAHEIGHHLLHFGDRRTETTKRVRETEAEAVAFVVSQAIGLEAMSSASEYISLYSGDKDLLVESLEHIQRASAEIITAITAPDQLFGWEARGGVLPRFLSVSFSLNTPIL